MRKPEQAPEPSIEEILASIRKIIADDGDQAQPVAPPKPIYASSGPNVKQHAFPGQDRPRVADRFQAEPDRPAEYQADDEILELTEDFMLEEEADASGGVDYAEASQPQHAAAVPKERYSSGSHSLADELSMGAGLESVLSNVVAEVNRLSAAKSGPEAPPVGPGADWPEPAARATRPVAPAPRPSVRDDAEAHETGSSAAGGRAAADRSGPRPVWSARRLEGEAPRTRGTQFRADKPAEPQPAPPKAQGITGRDNWADGVQMPVPASGPAAPFPQNQRDEPEAEPPLSGSDVAAVSEIDKEKTFVGEVLTRVFGGSAKKPAEPRPEPAGPQAKAEELARTTIADFATEKLRAPMLGDALHADKPFMDAITNSLATALAETQAAHGQPSPDELPEALLPPDSDLASFAAPPLAEPVMRGAPIQPLRTKPEPVAEPPEWPRDDVEDLFDEAGPVDMPRVDIAPVRVAAARPPVETYPAAPALSLPAGLEDGIKEMVKPLIVAWLNENLPRIVENAVREELSGHDVTSGVGDRGPRR